MSSLDEGARQSQRRVESGANNSVGWQLKRWCQPKWMAPQIRSTVGMRPNPSNSGKSVLTLQGGGRVQDASNEMCMLIKFNSAFFLDLKWFRLCRPCLYMYEYCAKPLFRWMSFPETTETLIVFERSHVIDVNLSLNLVLPVLLHHPQHTLRTIFPHGDSRH